GEGNARREAVDAEDARGSAAAFCPRAEPAGDRTKSGDQHGGCERLPEQGPVPDWAAVHRELRRPNVTLALLWEEYRAGPGGQDGFGYSWFCELYRAWVGRLQPTLRQVHPAGERVFVDFAGHMMEVIDAATGEIRRAEVFVAVLGASSYTYAQATWTQSLPDWIGAHVRMLSFFGGVPRQIV